MSLNVLIADDHGIVREGIRALLQNATGINVVGVAENGRQTIELVSKLKPDLVLMDVTMPELNGIEATGQLMKEFPKLRILALSTHADHRYVSAMLHAGATGYLLKECLFDELLFAIHAIQNGQSYLSPAIAHLVLSDYRQKASRQEGTVSSTAEESQLTEREREVLQLLAEGHTMKDIAVHLSISVKTVETHRMHMADKLKLRTNTELTRYAIREGIISA